MFSWQNKEINYKLSLLLFLMPDLNVSTIRASSRRGTGMIQRFFLFFNGKCTVIPDSYKKEYQE